MCIMKKPKVVSQPAAAEKDPAILRNPYLDGLDAIVRARQGGVRSLTIRRREPGAQVPTPPVPPIIQPENPGRPPISGGGGGGSTGGGNGGLTDRQRDTLDMLAILPGRLGVAGRTLLKKVST